LHQFGESAKLYGGSNKDRTLGLGQGNAAAGPGFLALSSLIVNAYLRKGHGTRQVLSFTQRLLVLAAVIYVDDTDLPHMTKHITATSTELIKHSQKSTNVWGGLAIATGAALKPEKCYAYFFTYCYANGQASMADIINLLTPLCILPQSEGPPLPSHLTVPLPDCTSAPIPTLPTNTALLILGIWFGPLSLKTKHMLEMRCKGLIWADKLHAQPLSHSEAWTSFTLQLYPGMSWGISTVVLSSHKLFEAIQPVCFKCLPLLDVQCHIELPWRTLPKSYQGFGLPNFALHSFASKLQLTQCIWGFDDAASRSMMMGYESFLMDIGMYGNSLGYNYNQYSRLAMDNTWFKNVWELLRDFSVEATFGEEF
jgi:hypothetical protein